MEKELSVLEKMCRSFDVNKMKPVLSEKNAVSAIIAFQDKNPPLVYCPLRGERVKEGNTILLEYYCKANPDKRIICPYTQEYGR